MTKRKLLISMMTMIFVLLSVAATVAIVFALTQQSISTSLNIGYTVEDIDGTVSATYTIGGEEKNLIPEADAEHISEDGKSLVFKAVDSTSAGNLKFPGDEEIVLSAQADNLVIKYTYSNLGEKHYIASMSLNSGLSSENMRIEYGIWDSIEEVVKYSEQRYALVVPAEKELSYWIKISIDDLAKEASFDCDFNWLLEGTNKYTEAEYLSLTSLEFIASDGGYAARVASAGEYIGALVFPSQINGNAVTKIVSNSSLTQSYKNQITSVSIPDSVTTIQSLAFNNYSSLTRVDITDLNKWVQISFETETSNPLYYAKNLYLNGELVTEVEIDNSITKTGNYLFYGCTSIKSVTIPSTLTSLGSMAFSGMSLTNLNVETGNAKYHSAGNCIIDTSYKRIVQGCNGSIIPNDGTVDSIWSNAFVGCTMESIIIPNSIKTTGSNVFQDCPNLTRVNITDINRWVQISFGNYMSNPLHLQNAKLYLNGIEVTDVVVGDSVTTIGAYVFYNYKSLSSVTLCEGVTTIGSNAFTMANMQSISIPTSLNTIQNNAFTSCFKLKRVDIKDIDKWVQINFAGPSGTFAYANPLCENADLYLNDTLVTNVVLSDSVTKISDYAFNNYKKLTSITMGSGVSSVGNCAFYGCTGLTNLTIGENVRSIGNYAFYGCTGLTEIEIPNSVTSIGNYAFDNCTGLINLNIGENVTSIGTQGFRGCSSLKLIEVSSNNTTYQSKENCLIEIASKKLILGCKTSKIPTDGSVTSIGSYAFYGCTSLTEIEIPNNVTSIGSYAFYRCTALTNVIFKNTTGWFVASSASATTGTSVDVTSANTNLISWLTTSGYYYKYWKRA